MRIVDFSTHLSGPIASHLLHELGAEVIKVENPRTGDGNRGAFPVTESVDLMHLALNGGARSIAADRRSPEWSRLIDSCARWADAVIVGARPADARRRGIDFLTFQRSQPEIVYCSISGYGDVGPWKDLTAHGQSIDSYAGLVDVVAGDGQTVTRPGWRSTGTTLAGVFAAFGVSAALFRRAAGLARAQYLSVSIWQAAMWWSWRDLTMLANAGKPWGEYNDLGSRYGLYDTADGRTLLLAPIEQRFWESFCEIAGLSQERRSAGNWRASGMEFGEGEDFAEEREEIADRVRRRTLEEWVATLGATEIPFAPVLSVAEALNSEHARVNGVMRETTVDGRTFQVAATPLREPGPGGGQELAAPGPLASPPAIGEHTSEVLHELGLDDVDPAVLASAAQSSDIVGVRPAK